MKRIFFLLFLGLNFTLKAGNFQQALNLVEQKKWSEAESEFKKHLDQHPLDSKAYYNIGLCLLHQQKELDAIWFFEKSLKLNPKNKWAIPHLESCQKKLNNVFSWEPANGHFKASVFQLSVSKLTIICFVLSMISALLIFLAFLRKKFRKLFIILLFPCLTLFITTVYFTREKMWNNSHETHGIIQVSLDDTFAAKQGNALIPVSVRAGERGELIEKGKRIGLRLANETVVWLEKEQVKLF